MHRQHVDSHRLVVAVRESPLHNSSCLLIVSVRLCSFAHRNLSFALSVAIEEILEHLFLQLRSRANDVELRLLAFCKVDFL